MIIDFHTHTFPDRIAAAAVARMSAAAHITAYTDGALHSLSDSMRRAGIDRSVSLPVVTNPEKTAHINDYAAEMNGKNGVFHLGGLHPDTPDLEKEAARLPGLGLRGVKIHPVYQRADLCDPRCLRLLAAAGENGLFVITHAGMDIGFPGQTQSAVQNIERALRQAGPVTLVLAHMGGWRQWEEALALAAWPNVYIDTSFSLGRITPAAPGYYSEAACRLLSDAAAVRIIRAFGAERVLFGTDSPWADQSRALSDFRRLPLTPEERDLILYKNAGRLLGIGENKDE
jgi:predicted TIM-barrel fold metal-dependent hydrolase